jgi:alpha-galactosidase
MTKGQDGGVASDADGVDRQPRHLAGPSRIGLGPGRPFVHLLPIPGEVGTLRIDGLPAGLTVDRATRVISGSTMAAGSHIVTVSGEGPDGPWVEELELVVGGEICLTPPLGWNSWNVFGATVTEDHIRGTAKALLDTGLAAHGWSAVNIDDGWQGSRDRRGRLQPNEKFDDLGVLCDDMHALGLRVGIYSSPGPRTCAGFPGSAGYEAEDARSFAEWGFDYLKYDWCSAGPIDDATPLETLIAPYARMRDALDRVERDIVYHLCQYGYGRVWEWARARAGANAWRTSGDIDDAWDVVDRIGFGQADLATFAAPGGWNDPDMLVLGAVGGAWGRPIRPTRLTAVEQRSHLSLWVLSSAPLLLGCDLTILDESTRAMLCNRDLLAVHQDALGRQAAPISVVGLLEIWSKPLDDGSLAVGVFNRGPSPVTASLDWAALGIRPSAVRDLWTGRSIAALDGWQEVLPGHGSAILRAW